MVPVLSRLDCASIVNYLMDSKEWILSDERGGKEHE